MRVADMFMTFPTSILSFFMVGVLGTGLTNVIIAIALSHWAWYARMVRKPGDFTTPTRVCAGVTAFRCGPCAGVTGIIWQAR